MFSLNVAIQKFKKDECPRIGSGVYRTAYLVEHKGEKAVLKVVRMFKHDTGTIAARECNYAEYMLWNKHFKGNDRFAEVYDMSNDHKFLLMEYIPLKSYGDYISCDNFWREYQAMHHDIPREKMLMVYRDLHIDNVRLRSNLRCVIIDYGNWDMVQNIAPGFVEEYEGVLNNVKPSWWMPAD